MFALFNKSMYGDAKANAPKVSLTQVSAPTKEETLDDVVAVPF